MHAYVHQYLLNYWPWQSLKNEKEQDRKENMTAQARQKWQDIIKVLIGNSAN